MGLFAEFAPASCRKSALVLASLLRMKYSAVPERTKEGGREEGGGGGGEFCGSAERRER